MKPSMISEDEKFGLVLHRQAMPGQRLSQYRTLHSLNECTKPNRMLQADWCHVHFKFQFKLQSSTSCWQMHWMKAAGEKLLKKHISCVYLVCRMCTEGCTHFNMNRFLAFEEECQGYEAPCNIQTSRHERSVMPLCVSFKVTTAVDMQIVSPVNTGIKWGEYAESDKRYRMGSST